MLMKPETITRVERHLIAAMEVSLQYAECFLCVSWSDHPDVCSCASQAASRTVGKTPTRRDYVFKSTANLTSSLGFVDWSSLVVYVALANKDVPLPELPTHQNKAAGEGCLQPQVRHV